MIWHISPGTCCQQDFIQVPIPYADVTTTTTHKTLRGPRGGLILCNQEAADKFNFNKAVFPGIQGGPLEHVIAGKAVCFKEALEPEFAEYQKQIIKNAQALSKGLMGRGVKIISGGTDNHLMLIDLRGEEVTGKELEKRLERALEDAARTIDERDGKLYAILEDTNPWHSPLSDEPEEGLIPCEVVRSSRKTIAIQITAEGRLVLRIPRRASVQAAMRFAEEHRDG